MAFRRYTWVGSEGAAPVSYYACDTIVDRDSIPPGQLVTGDRCHLVTPTTIFVWSGTGWMSTTSGSYAPGTINIPDGVFVLKSRRLELTGVQRITALGTGRMRVT